jgi:hypothetical protein
MGDFVGSGAQTRLTLWACLNYKFSPLKIRETAEEFTRFLAAGKKGMNVEEAIRLGLFYDFAVHLGCVMEVRGRNSRLGWNFFEPGTIDILSMVVFRNLAGLYPSALDKANPSHPDQKQALLVNGRPGRRQRSDRGLRNLYPRPMMFERTFGDREEIVIRSTKYGIRVILQSQTEDMVNERTKTRFKSGTEQGFS